MMEFSELRLAIGESREFRFGEAGMTVTCSRLSEWEFRYDVHMEPTQDRPDAPSVSDLPSLAVPSPVSHSPLGSSNGRGAPARKPYTLYEAMKEPTRPHLLADTPRKIP